MVATDPPPLNTIAGRKFTVTPEIPNAPGRFCPVGFENPSVTGKYWKPARASFRSDAEKLCVSSMTKLFKGKVRSELPSSCRLLLEGADTNCCDQRPITWSLSEGTKSILRSP